MIPATNQPGGARGGRGGHGILRGHGVRRLRRLSCSIALCFVLAACGGEGGSEAVTGTASPSGPAPTARDNAAAATLAYEHTLGIALPADAIPARIAALRAACDDGRFGECVVLHVRQHGGDRPSGSVGMRIVPDGVEPMIGFASEGAEQGARNTHAEDLATVMRDSALAQERLRRELARLQEFEARPGLAVADVIALSERMAAVEALLEAADREAAHHRRRVETQRLTVDIGVVREQGARNEITGALRDFGSVLATGTAWTIRATAFLLPLLLVVLVVLAVRRRRRRRAQ